MLDTRNSELHSLEELRSQFGQFRESVLKELQPVSSPSNPESLRSNASAGLPNAGAPELQPVFNSSHEPTSDGFGLGNMGGIQKATSNSFSSTDDEVEDANLSSAVHCSDLRVSTPMRQSPSCQTTSFHAVSRTLSPAEAGKQALVIERERDALLSSGLYQEHGNSST